jgi:MOSC domain-containing protein YiiM
LVQSVNLGQIRDLEWRDKTHRTGFIKEPVTGAAALTDFGFEDDRQADLTVHGGPDKAVYAYPAEHYPFWEEVLERELSPGAFGENLTVTGLLEEEVEIGDRLKIGRVELVVTQPRLPCTKMEARFERSDMIKRFTKEQRTGFYLRVRKAGSIAAGAEIKRVAGSRAGSVSVADVFRLLTGQSSDQAARERALASPHLGKGARVGLS